MQELGIEASISLFPGREGELFFTCVSSSRCFSLLLFLFPWNHFSAKPTGFPFQLLQPMLPFVLLSALCLISLLTSFQSYGLTTNLSSSC